MATSRLHVWLLQATGQAHLGRWRLARSREFAGGADAGIEVFDALELSFECTETLSEAWKECRRSSEDATETVAAAGGAQTGLETPTPSVGCDVVTIPLLTKTHGA